ncbi:MULTISPECIES: ABC transporter permease [Arthrobacter]|uniref:ABC transporter permease n=2 Tax=Arthrobacter TaxID=1663 RepID=A0ABU9KNP6_9MICC|nr:ABC transporter permease [Arthrobacter sp. YJM1]MDP5227792.1 ABC transporter permease [Arthrobacter sp. YJM1]
MSAFFSTILEAWQELRVHKVRVMLSLIGVAVSVAALTGVLGLGDVAREGMRDQAERQGGRAATLDVNLYGEHGPVPAQKTIQLMDGLTAKYKFTQITRTSRTSLDIQFPDGVRSAQAVTVDPAYGAIHRVAMVQGRWFSSDDNQLLAPALVVNENTWRMLGSPALHSNPGVQLRKDGPHSAVVIGVVRNNWPEEPPSAFLLQGAGDILGLALEGAEYKIWVDPAQADQIRQSLEADISAQLPGVNGGVSRMDYLAYGDPLGAVQWVVGGIAGLILLLGALGMLTVSLVTVRHRVREIGIRRSFGATSGRIFVGVMMESVVATTVAGLVGVLLAVAVVKNPWIESKLAPSLLEYPPFPLGAALLGMAAAVLVGALAGAIPALIAVRVKVIDAIRF